MTSQGSRFSRREGASRLTDEVFNMRNLHSYTPKHCGEACCMCCSYSPPCIIFFLIVVLTVGYDAYFITLCLKFHADWRTAFAVICILLGTAASAMLLWAFLGAVTTAAGYVPADPWKYPPTYVGRRKDFQPPAPSSNGGSNPNSVTQLDRANQLRYCASCEQYKPDNAYHCNFCARCTYQFDHHCPAINNCIGRDNYKLFVTFLVYVGVVGFFNGGLMLIGIFALEGGDWNIAWIMFSAFILVLAVTLLSFGLTHVCWICRGQSTMSRHVASFNREGSRRQSRQQLEQSRRAHWDAVLGTDRRWWRMLLPLRPRWPAPEETV
ncbi:zinc finger protein [Trypanosoma conorhini]|uniref:Palmitoyltransferase n=1 Tax=Trypanosoma conorhini TaxID=83891 RepID=A0A3R7P1Y0_9TRYP|nr:zinc finger protein [Trypanosoma conorhini]RNF27577.1 zinc finger protein [Trypanosoma conorhini]